MNFNWLANLAKALVNQQHSPVMIMLAGPNGSGKSTFYFHSLEVLGYEFLNADISAQEVFGEHPQDDNQSRQMQSFITKAVEDALVSRKSFVRETVFSDTKGYKIQEIKDAKQKEYFVVLIYIGIESPDLSAARVAQRVEHGGHKVPYDKLPSRYYNSLANLSNAIGITDRTYVFDNSYADKPITCLLVFNEGLPIYQHKSMPGWIKHHLQLSGSE